MLVGERKQVCAALLDPAGRGSLTSAFWSSRECRYFVGAALTPWLERGRNCSDAAVWSRLVQVDVSSSEACPDRRNFGGGPDGLMARGSAFGDLLMSLRSGSDAGLMRASAALTR